jgi:hypothetical protein
MFRQCVSNYLIVISCRCGVYGGIPLPLHGGTGEDVGEDGELLPCTFQQASRTGKHSRVW